LEFAAMSVAEPAPPEPDVAVAGDAELHPEEVARTVGGSGHEHQDLAATVLPHAVVKRIIKGACPDARFSRDALAGLNRVAQSFAMFATDRALAEQAKESEKLKKLPKSKHNPLTRRSLTVDHVMRFLSVELAPIANKVSSLYPELMPHGFKPAGVKLLEQLAGQADSKRCQSAEAATIETAGVSLGEQSQAGACETRPSDVDAKPARGHKRSRQDANSSGGDAKCATAKKAKDVVPLQSASLSMFFGSNRPPAASQSTPAATKEAEVSASGGIAAPVPATEVEEEEKDAQTREF